MRVAKLSKSSSLHYVKWVRQFWPQYKCRGVLFYDLRTALRISIWSKPYLFFYIYNDNIKVGISQLIRCFMSV